METTNPQESQRSILVHDGTKFFWRTRTSLDVTISDHPTHNVLEISAYEPIMNKEAPRLYINTESVMKMIDQEKIEEKIRFAQRNNVLIKDNFRSDLIYKEISDLLLPRLVIKELSIDNKLFEVTLKTFTTDDIFMCDVPDGLVPNRSLHFKHLLDGAVDMVLDSLEHDKQLLLASTDIAADMSEHTFDSQLTVRQRWRMPLVLRKVNSGKHLNQQDMLIFKKVESNMKTSEDVTNMKMVMRMAPSAAATPRSTLASPRSVITTPRKVPSSSTFRSMHQTNSTSPSRLHEETASSSMHHTSTHTSTHTGTGKASSHAHHSASAATIRKKLDKQISLRKKEKSSPSKPSRTTHKNKKNHRSACNDAEGDAEQNDDLYGWHDQEGAEACKLESTDETDSSFPPASVQGKHATPESTVGGAAVQEIDTTSTTVILTGKPGSQLQDEQVHVLNKPKHKKRPSLLRSFLLAFTSTPTPVVGARADASMDAGAGVVGGNKASTRSSMTAPLITSLTSLMQWGSQKKVVPVVQENALTGEANV